VSQQLIITIDGPAGAGKSTTARRVAERLGYQYIDSGAMYRVITLAALKRSVPRTNKDLGELAQSLRIGFLPGFGGQRVTMNLVDVTEEIRSPEVTANVSEISSFHDVRTAMVQLQREYGLAGGIVMDGRDIGSVVFPFAQVKIFLKADLEVRAHRRAMEIESQGGNVSELALKNELDRRDKLDSEREESPLVVPDGAIEVDTTNMTIDEQVETILEIVRKYQRTYDMISSFGDI
jgi:CMP/dCMP kinase